MASLTRFYDELYAFYGPQGWWPLLECKGGKPAKTGSIQGYHPGDYSYPKTERQRFEICLGAILTQNTSWVQAEKALRNLDALEAIDSRRILALDLRRLKAALRPAGYFNQKAKKCRAFAQFYSSLKGRTPRRDELLSVWGVGEETADSILLYAYKVPTFVVDAYTKRVFSGLGLVKSDSTYGEMKGAFERALPHDQEVYQEYHALIVEHAKRGRNVGVAKLSAAAKGPRWRLMGKSI